MSQSGVNYVKFYPERFFEYMRENRYPVYHKSPIFFRDFQYGLWRFLQQDGVKIAYADMEKASAEVIASYKERGIFREINRQTFELNLPEFITVWPTADDGKTATAPAKGKPAPASGPAANQAPAATPAAGGSAAATSGAPISVADAAAMSPEVKAAKIAEIKAKMEAAKQRRLSGEG
jgi:hypothetical protein